MWRVGIAAAALGLVATAAPAQPDGQGADHPPPLSVWRIDGASAEHLQSGLVCPAQFRTYRRTTIHVFDRFGLDVGCNYLDPAQSDVTVYVTRRSGPTAADVMADAKREFLQAHADIHPQVISETQTRVSGLAWAVALYSADGGMRDAIWIADLDGWTLEYRTTYRADGEGRAAADMDAFIAAATASTGAQLALCGKSPLPARTGVAVPVGDRAGDDAMMSAIVGGAEQNAVQMGKTAPPHPIVWCAEQAIPGEQADLLFWRGVLADGADARADRVTAMTPGEPTALVAADDPLVDSVRHPDGQPPYWQATMVRDGRTSIWAEFTDRPRSDALASLYLDILSGKALPLISYDVRDRKLHISLPATK
jgi:hypothetical protein